ncbi:MAG: hypothetical protein L3J19_05580 [Sulfurimonas sp.]|nr:hypothetical protein [Sulfurimonas sp.]
MKITRELTLKTMRYLEENKDFYFPFKIICNDFCKDSNFYDMDCKEIEYSAINDNISLINFELEENLQNLCEETTGLMAKGFIDKIEQENIVEKISNLAVEYRKSWKKDLWESEDIEEYGLNEFIGGKAEAYEECLKLLIK